MQKRFFVFNKIIVTGFFLLFLVNGSLSAQDQLCVFDSKKGKPSSCKDMDATVTEIKRFGQTSVVHVRVLKRGTYAGVIMFQNCCFSWITRTRGFRYYVVLSEEELNDCDECEWSTAYVIGFFNSETESLKVTFPRHYQKGKPYKVVDINTNSTLCGFLPIPADNFFKAVHNNDIKSVKAMLKKNKNLVNKKNKDGNRPLHVSVMEGHREMSEYLVASGADINSKGNWGWAPLHLAVRTNKIQMVKLLLRLKANVNIKMEMGNTPLHNAAYRDNVKIARLLIKNGAAIDEMDISWNTPLHGAAARGKLDMVKFLLRKGADRKKININGLSPLGMAKKGKRADVIRFLNATQ